MKISSNFIEEAKKFLWNDLENFLNHCSKPLKKSIKILISKINVEDFIKINEAYWRKLTDPWFTNDNLPNDIYYIDRKNTDIPLWKTFWHQSWYIYIQEVAAWLVARFLAMEKPSLILDISSAPWWKTIQIWDFLNYLNVDYYIVANDINSDRILALSHNINRTWIYKSWITKLNWFSFWKNLPEVFDAVLVDAPCSWEWTMFKNDFSLKYRKKEEIKKICWTQYQLLISALKSTKVWWTIIFSTCTINPYENEWNIYKLLNEYWEYIILENINIINKSNCLKIENINLKEDDCRKIARLRPHIHWTWWFFIAKIRKIKSIWKNKINYLNNNLKIQIANNNKVYDFLKNWWIDINDELFLETKDKLYVTWKKFLEIKDYIWFEKIWIPIAKKDNFWIYHPLHELWIVFWNKAKKNIIEITYDEAERYALWANLNLKEWNINNPYRNYIILKFQKYPIWIGKIVWDMIKNKYIK